MIYFVSDVHLGLFERSEDKKREDHFLQFLRAIAKDCTHLYIVGDLFDFWFEYNTVIPRFFYRTLAAFADMKAKGIEIVYLMGNHDFGHKDFFRNELGIEIHKDHLEQIHNGKRFFLYHGDGLAHMDAPYRMLKKILRSPFNQWLYRKLHPDWGIGLASSSSRKSRKHTSQKKYGPTDGMEEFAEEKIRSGFDYVVMGHRHRLLKKEIGSGTYINLGDWIKKPAFGCFDGNNFELVYTDDFLK